MTVEDVAKVKPAKMPTAAAVPSYENELAVLLDLH